MPKKKSVISKSAKAVMTGVIVGSLGVGGAVAGVGSINQHSISPTIENAYGEETYEYVGSPFSNQGFNVPSIPSTLDRHTFNNFGFVNNNNKTATVYGTIFAKPNSKVTVIFRAYVGLTGKTLAIKKNSFNVDNTGVLNINYTWSFDKDKDKDVAYKNMMLVPQGGNWNTQKKAYTNPPAGIMFVNGELAKLSTEEKKLIGNTRIRRVFQNGTSSTELGEQGVVYDLDFTNDGAQGCTKKNSPHFSKALEIFSKSHTAVFNFGQPETMYGFRDNISNDVIPSNKHFYTYYNGRGDLKSAIEKEYGFNYLPILVKGSNGKEYIYDYLTVSSAVPSDDTQAGAGIDAKLASLVNSAMSDYTKKHPEISFDEMQRDFVDYRKNGKLEVHAKYDEQYLMNHEEALKAHLETLSKRYHIMKRINSAFRTDFPEYAYLNDVFPEYGVVDLEKYKHYYGNSDVYNILENVDFNKYYETMTNISPVDNMSVNALVDKVIKSYTTADLSDEIKTILHSAHSNNNPVNPIFKDAVDRIDWYKYTWGHKFSQIEIEQFSDTLEKSNIDGQIFGFDSNNSVLLKLIPANRNNIVAVKQGILNSDEIYSLNKRLGKIKIPVTSHEGKLKYGFVEIDPVIECDGLYDLHTAIYNTVNIAMKNWLKNNQPQLVENKILSLNLVNKYNNTVHLTREIDKDNFFSLLRLNEYKFDGELEVQGAKITGQDYVKYNYVPKMVDLVQRELNLVSLGNKLGIDIKDMYQDFKSVNDIGIRMDFIKLCRTEFEKDSYKQGTLYSEENVLGYTDDVMRIGKEKIQAELNLVKSMEKKIESGIKTQSAQYGFNKQLEKDLMFLLQSISENENMTLEVDKVETAVQKVRSYKNAEDKIVNFEDENLKQYVLNVMKDQKLIPEDAVSITEKQALLLTRLELIGHPYEYKAIRSLKGLGRFENLKTLALNKLYLPESSTYHEIILNHLKRLERLIIRDSDVDTRKLVLATCNLLNLNYLALINDSLTKNVQDGANSSIDLSMIGMLKTLKIVGIPFEPITCHVSLPIGLESFSLQFGNFDISGSNMLKEVNFNKCANNGISGSDTPLTKFLKSCPNLEKITINNVKNITNTVSSWGGNLKKLKWLSLNNTDLNDMNVFPESLEHFEGSHCNLSSVIPFKDLKNLNFLNIGYNHITDLVPVKHVKYVKANNQKISLQPKSAKVRLFEQVPALGTPALTTPDNNIIDGVLAYNAATMNTPYTVKLNDHSQDYNQEYSATVNVDFLKANKTPVVQFKDENLKQALLQIMKDNQLIDRDATDITEEEAAKLKLYGRIRIHNGVKDLTGLEKFTNIFALNISDNPITNLEPLRGMKNLFDLDISDTKVNDLTPLSDLQNLSNLEATGLHLKSLSPLLAHKNPISVLGLDNTKIDDGYNDISQFSELTSLNLEGNNISDTGFLSGLSKLKILYLNDNAVLDVAPLKSLTTLTSLHLYNQKALINSNTQTVHSLFKYKDECKVSILGSEGNNCGHFDGSNFVLDIIPQKDPSDKWTVKVDIANKPNITGINTMGGIDKFVKDSKTDKYYSMALTIDFTDYVNSLIKKVQDAQGNNTAKQKIIDKINQGNVSIEDIENDIKQLHKTTPIQFKDQVLKHEIINALLAKGVKLNGGEVTDADCENLTELSIGFPETGIGGKIQQITNLSDLQYLKNLKKITIANGHDISDLSPLAQCPQLETINIAGVNNPDVTPLKSLTKLKSVSLPDQNYRLASSKDTVSLNFLHHLSDITLVSNDGNPAYGSIQGNDFILGTFPANNVARINFKCEKSSIDGVPIGTYTGTISIDYSEYRKKIEEMIKLLDEKKAKDIQGKINSGHMSMVELHKDLESVENAPVFTEKRLYKILARALGKEEGYIVKKEDLDKIQSIKLTKEEFETMEFLKDDFHQLKSLKSIDASNLGAETFNKIELKLGTKLVKDKIKPAPLEKFSADNNHIFSIDKLSNSVITFHGQTFTNTATGRAVNISQLTYDHYYTPENLKRSKYTGLISSSLGEAISQGQEKYGYKFIEKNFTGNVRLDKIPTKPQIDISVSNPRYKFDGVYTVDFAPYIQSLKDKVADSTAEKEEKDLVLKMINTAGTSIDDIEMAILRLGKTAPSGTQTEDISGELQKLLDSYNSVKATDNYKNADDNLKQTYDAAITEGQKVYDKLSSTPEQVKQVQQTIQSALEALNGDKKAQAIKEQLNTTTQQVSSLQGQLEKAKQQGTADKSKIEQLSGQISTLNSQLEQLKTDNSKSIEQKQQEIAKLNGQIADLNKQVAQLTQDKQSLQSQLDTATSKVQNLTGELENAKRQGVTDKATIERINGELQQAKQQLEQLKQDKTKSDEEKQKEINQLNTKITELGKQITQLTQEKSSLAEQLQTAQQSISTLQDKLQKATEQGTADKSKIEQLNGQISTLNSQLEKIKSDKTLSEQQKQAEIDKLNGQVTDLGKQVAQLTKDKQNLQSQIEQLNKKVDELNTKANTCSISDGEKAKELEKVKGELQQTKQQLEQLKQDKTKSDEEKQAEINKLNGQVTELGKQIEQLTEAKNSLQQQLDNANGKIQTLTGELDKAKQQGTTDKATIERITGELQQTKQQLEQLKQDKTKSDEQKQKEIGQLNGKIADLGNQIKQLNSDKESLTQQLQTAQQSLSETQQKLKKAEEQGVLDSQTISGLNEQIKTLNGQIEKLKSDKTLSEQEKQAEIEKLNGQIAQLTKDKQELQGKLDTADSNVQKLTGELEKAKQQNTTDKETIDRITGELQQTKQQLDQLKQDKTKSDEQKQAEINKLNTKIADLGEQITQLTKDKETLQQQLTKTQENVNTLQSELEKAKQQGTVDKAKIEKLTSQVDTLNKQVKQLEDDKVKSEQEKKAELDVLNKQIEKLKKDLNDSIMGISHEPTIKIQPNGDKVINDKITVKPSGEITVDDKTVTPDKKIVTPSGTISGDKVETKGGTELEPNKITVHTEKGKVVVTPNTVDMSDGKEPIHIGKDEITLPNGMKVDKQGNVTLPDGTKVNTNGDVIESGDTTVNIDNLPNGSFTTPDGTKIEKGDNGGIKITKDNTVVETTPDGTVNIYNNGTKDNVTIASNDDGTTTVTVNDGTEHSKEITIKDGTMTIDGNTVDKDKVVTPEGNTVDKYGAHVGDIQIKPNGDVKVGVVTIDNKGEILNLQSSMVHPLVYNKPAFDLEKYKQEHPEEFAEPDKSMGNPPADESGLKDYNKKYEKLINDKINQLEQKQLSDEQRKEIDELKKDLEQFSNEKEKPTVYNNVNKRLDDLLNNTTTPTDSSIKNQVEKINNAVSKIEEEVNTVPDKKEHEKIVNKIQEIKDKAETIANDTTTSTPEKQKELNKLNNEIDNISNSVEEHKQKPVVEPEVKVNPDGSHTINNDVTVKPNGEITKGDVTITPDKKVVTPDVTVENGTVTTKTGTTVTPNKVVTKNGATVTPDTITSGDKELKVNPDGSVETKDGTKVYNDKVVTPEGDTINSDGTITDKNGHLVTKEDSKDKGYTVTNENGKTVVTTNNGKDKIVVSPDGNTVNGVTVEKPKDNKTNITVDNENITVGGGTVTVGGITTDKDKVVTPGGVVVDNQGTHVDGTITVHKGKFIVNGNTISNEGGKTVLGSSLVNPLINDKPAFDLEKYKKEHPEEFAKPDKSMGDIPTDEQGLKDYNRKYKKVIENKIKNIEEAQQPEKARELINQLKHDIDGIENDIQSEKEKSIVYDAINKQLDDIKNIIDGGEKKSINDQISDVNNEISKIKETPENKVTIEKIKKDIENIANGTPSEQQKKINEINYKLDKIKQQGALPNIKEDTPSDTTHGTTSGGTEHSNSSARETIKSIDKEIDKALENNSIDRAKATAIKTKLAELKNELSAIEASRVISKQEKEEKIKAIEKQLEELKKETEKSIKPTQSTQEKKDENTDNKTEKSEDKTPIEKIEKTDNLHDERVFDKDKQGKHERLPKTSDTTGILYSLLTGVGVLVGMTMRKAKKAKHAKK